MSPQPSSIRLCEGACGCSWLLFKCTAGLWLRDRLPKLPQESLLKCYHLLEVVVHTCHPSSEVGSVGYVAGPVSLTHKHDAISVIRAHCEKKTGTRMFNKHSACSEISTRKQDLLQENKEPCASHAIKRWSTHPSPRVSPDPAPIINKTLNTLLFLVFLFWTFPGFLLFYFGLETLCSSFFLFCFPDLRYFATLCYAWAL